MKKIYSRRSTTLADEPNRQVTVHLAAVRNSSGIHERIVSWRADDVEALYAWVRGLNFKYWVVEPVSGDDASIEEFTVAVIAAQLSK